MATETEERLNAGIPSPVSLGGMARQAWQLYETNFVTLVLAFVPFFVLGAALFLLFATTVDVSARTFLLLVLVHDLLHVVIASCGVAVAHVVLADRLAGRPGRLRDALKEGVSAIPSIVPLIILATIPYCVAFLLLGPFLRELFVGPPIVVTVIVLEKKRIGEALARARELMDMNWSRILLYLVTFAAGLGVLDLVVQRLAWAALTDVESAVLGYLLAGAIAVIYPSIVVAFIACVWLIAYFDLRARAEDFNEPAMIALREAPPPPK